MLPHLPSHAMTLPTAFQPVPDKTICHGILRWLIALVWLVNGLWCKMLGMVPRHEAIAAKILGLEDAGGLIRLIGFSEILMAVWVLSRIQPRLNGWTQIIIVAVMNVLEFSLAPELLLFGRGNAPVALGFIAVVYWHSCRRATIALPA